MVISSEGSVYSTCRRVSKYITRHETCASHNLTRCQRSQGFIDERCVQAQAVL